MAIVIIHSNYPSVNPPSPGHTWIEIRHNDGSSEYYGYYPQAGGLGNIDGPGKVEWETDGNRIPDRSSQEIYITSEQIGLIRDFVRYSEAGSYSLDGVGINDTVGTWNCATWVRDAIQLAGIEVNIPVLVIAPWWLPSRFPSLGPLPDTWDAEGWGGIDPYGVDPIGNTSYHNRCPYPHPTPRDPLAIDLDGDGIETVGSVSNPVLFDHNADGIRAGTGWVTPDDAWLVLDRNGNGLIDSGRELFGVDTVLSGTPGLDAVYASTGFQALRTLDANADNIFNAPTPPSPRCACGAT